MAQTRLIRAKYFEPGMTVPYMLLSCGDLIRSAMSPVVADEIVRCSDTIETSEFAGFEVKVDNIMCFPADVFELAPEPRKRQKRR